METFLMTKRELSQVKVFEDLKHKRIKQKEAAEMLDLSIRQIKRKFKIYCALGTTSLIHGNRGRESNRATNPDLVLRALNLVKENYADFGPTFASEKLLDNHKIDLDHETLRRLMIKDGIWKVKAQKVAVKHFWRERKDCLGEMVQLDGSPHHWFENRAEPCTLIAFIDDATSRILWLEFAKSESTESLMNATKNYLLRHGAPASYYTDRGVVYRINHNNPDGDKVTQYKRAMDELHIKLIHARSPEAKGRIENLFGTLQDRLVKELRLANISTVDEASEFAQTIYMPKHNAKFSVKPKSATNLHKAIENYDLEQILCLKEERQINNDFTITYKGKWLQLLEKQATIVRPKTTITIHERLDGAIEVYLRKTKLNFKPLPERPKKAITLKAAPASKAHTPKADHPWRRYDPMLFKRDISIEFAR